jgi:hypothetical protein
MHRETQPLALAAPGSGRLIDPPGSCGGYAKSLPNLLHGTLSRMKSSRAFLGQANAWTKHRWRDASAYLALLYGKRWHNSTP